MKSFAALMLVLGLAIAADGIKDRSAAVVVFPYLPSSTKKRIVAIPNGSHTTDRKATEVHQNIQDYFNEAGIEINSPHYSSLREGSRIAMPEKLHTARLQRTSFGLRQINGSGKSPETA